MSQGTACTQLNVVQHTHHGGASPLRAFALLHILTVLPLCAPFLHRLQKLEYGKLGVQGDSRP
jgi:hypothetical protein